MSPEQTVRGYLEAMERRDLAAARAMLAPGFHMVFPGGQRFDSLEALVEWARGRYHSARKTYDRFTVREGRLVDQHVWNDMGEVLHR